jgi:cytosine/adenosine deaminase-related metal-dependent hydrolase
VEKVAGHEIGGGQASPPPRFLRVDAAAIIDFARGDAPGSILIELTDPKIGTFAAAGGTRAFHHARTRVLACGSPEHVDAHSAMVAEGLLHLRRPGCVLVPGLVNAHAHLDLTHIGPRPYEPEKGFMGFVDIVRSNRLMDDEAIAASVQRGIDLSLAGGVVAVGDIAGSVRGTPSLAPMRTLAASPLWGVSFLEFFAFGKGQEASLDRALAALTAAKALETPRVRVGLSPHAPYSVSPPMLEQAMEFARTQQPPVRVCTHVAETMEEREFIEKGTGPFRDLLERLGLWSDDLLEYVGQGRGSLDHFLRCAMDAGRYDPYSLSEPLIMAHVNDSPRSLDEHGFDDLFERAKDVVAMVAYCPRASSYFDAARHFGEHRFEQMHDSTLWVALGTDSVVNLPPDRHESGGASVSRISTLDEVRLLARTPGRQAQALLGLCTWWGAEALGLEKEKFTFTWGALAGLVAIQCDQTPTKPDSAIAWLDAALACDSAPELLLVGK